MNPNKRGFTQTEDVLAGFARVLPPGARLWDSESKAGFPFKRYYQRVLGGRLDVESHLIFGPSLDEPAAVKHAATLRAELEAGERVFITSLLMPERVVLAQLHRDLAGENAPRMAALVALSEDEFASTFPRYRFVRVDLPDTEGSYIYEIVARH